MAASLTTAMAMSKRMAAERGATAKTQRELARAGLDEASVAELLDETLDADGHVATLKSVALGTLGVLHAVSLSIHAIGRASAWARDRDPKHAVKQMDRLLSNQNVSVWLFSRARVRFVVGSRPEAIVAFDWTELDADRHSTMAAYLVTNHGRATPLLWKTVEKATLEGRRNRYEDELLEELAACLPDGMRVTILADRGFGDKARYAQRRALGMDFVIRSREGITLTDQPVRPDRERSDEGDSKHAGRATGSPDERPRGGAAGARVFEGEVRGNRRRYFRATRGGGPRRRPPRSGYFLAPVVL